MVKMFVFSKFWDKHLYEYIHGTFVYIIKDIQRCVYILISMKEIKLFRQKTLIRSYEIDMHYDCLCTPFPFK